MYTELFIGGSVILAVLVVCGAIIVSTWITLKVLIRVASKAVAANVLLAIDKEVVRRTIPSAPPKKGIR